MPQGSTSPRRDKFASLAASRQGGAEDSAAEKAPVSTVPTTTKRDKFAAMAQTTSQPKRDKFSAVAQAAVTPKIEMSLALEKDNHSSFSADMEIRKTPEEKMHELNQRIQQREKVFKDLETAEGCVWNLVRLASRTAENLTNLNVVDDDSSLSEISAKYRETLQKIHAVLSPHSAFVKNHQSDSDDSNMYAARVESRLAQERRHVLEELLRHEKENDEEHLVDSTGGSLGDKRKRGER
jgi:hypothetical protein